MEKIISMTAEEIRKSENVDAAFERAQKSKPMSVPNDGVRVATGFAAFKEHVKNSNQPIRNVRAAPRRSAVAAAVL